MAHVQITGEHVTIDGFDLTGKILAEGFSVEWHAAPGPPLVRMTVPAEVLDVDLPEAVIEALREPATDYASAIDSDNAALREINKSLKALLAAQKKHHEAAGRAVSKGISAAAAAAKARRHG